MSKKCAGNCSDVGHIEDALDSKIKGLIDQLSCKWPYRLCCRANRDVLEAWIRQQRREQQAGCLLTLGLGSKFENRLKSQEILDDFFKGNTLGLIVW